MKNKKSLFVIIGLIAILIVGGTLAAYFTSDYYPGTFETKPYNTSVTDLFVSPSNWVPGQTTTKRVFATNESDTDVAVRIAISDKWISANGNIIPKYQNGNLAAKINYVNQSDWIKNGKYYYYYKTLSKNESTSDFIDSVTFNRSIEIDDQCTTSEDNMSITCISSGNGFDNAEYQITFDIEMVQADAYKEIWNIDYNIGDTVKEYFIEHILEKASEFADIDKSQADIHEMYMFNHSATPKLEAVTDYRYIGDSPYNYVYFNCADYNDESTCEVWRILGIFEVEDEDGQLHKKVKLISPYVYSSYSWDNIRNWKESSMKTYLNEGDYWNYLTDETKEMISKSKYYYSQLYISGSYENSAEDFYKYERSLDLENYDNYFFDKISILYPSDYLYTFANGIDNVCFTTGTKCSTNYSGNPSTSWLYNSNTLKNGSSKENIYFLLNYLWFGNFYLYSSGYIYQSTSNSGVRPVLYLNPKMKVLSGDGSKDNPYIIDFESYNVTIDNNLFTVPSSAFPDFVVNIGYDDKYQLNSFKLNGETVIGNSFIMPEENVTITDINYQQIYYDIINNDSNINVVSRGHIGDEVSITPVSDHYEIKSFKINGETVIGNSFIMPEEDVTITDVEYHQLYYNITTNESNLSVVSGAFIGNKVVVSSISEDYSIESFKLNGETVNGNSFIMPEEDVTISDIVYRSSTFNITNSDEDITVPENARKGTTVTLLSDNYVIVSFKLNGETITGNTFIMPEEDVIITDIEKIERYIVESQHNPYNNSEDNTVYFEKTFEGAKSINVELTYQTESTTYDWIYLYQDSSTIYGSKFGGTTKKTINVIIPSNYLKIVFRTDGSVNEYYGFRAVITPNF
ncbi:MAG: hypothetical protein IJR82_00200 [Bacilli bacterium]|nr:hypothetical protein [Bacilli bacterium]